MLTLTNTTISNNAGEKYSGLAIISNFAQTTILNSTFAENQASASGELDGAESQTVWVAPLPLLV